MTCTRTRTCTYDCRQPLYSCGLTQKKGWNGPSLGVKGVQRNRRNLQRCAKGRAEHDWTAIRQQQGKSQPGGHDPLTEYQGRLGRKNVSREGKESSVQYYSGSRHPLPTELYTLLSGLIPEYDYPAISVKSLINGLMLKKIALMQYWPRKSLPNFETVVDFIRKICN